MNIFKKRINIKYFPDILKKEDAQEMVKKIPHNFPDYFKSIPRNMFNPVSKTFNRYGFTIKSCPGFINLHKRSLLITSPFDVQIKFDEKGILDERVGRFSNYKITEVHPNEQLLTYVKNSEYKFIIKLGLPFYIDSNVSLLMSTSCYDFNDFDVLSGILNSGYKKDVSFFIPIKKNQNELYFKKGQPLFLFTPLCENKIKLNFKKNKNIISPSLTFSNFKENILEKLT